MLRAVSRSPKAAGVAGTMVGSLRSGKSRAWICHRLVRSSRPESCTTSSGPTSSSFCRIRSMRGVMSSAISSRTAEPKRRRASSRSRACRRSSSRSSSTSMSALRVTRKAWCSTTSIPWKSSPMCAAMSSSAGTKAYSFSSPRSTRTKRGTLSGILTRAKCSMPESTSRMITARLRLRPEMYGNGCAGSTASGVSTGKIELRKSSDIAARCSAPSSDHERMRTPIASSSGRISSWNRRDWMSHSSRVRLPMCTSCSAGVRPSAERTDRPVLSRRFSPATRTM